MKLTLTLDEVSACAMALLSKAQEAEEEALGCEKLRRRSWNNRSQPSETIGFWKIKCKCCGKEMVFLINPKTLPHSNSRLAKHLMKGYLAEKLR